MLELSKLAIDIGLDGVVCPAPELLSIRPAIGHSPVIVTPGIRMPHEDHGDQRQIGTPRQALEDGADYLVIGRSLLNADDIEATLASFNLAETSH
jgi:orotidine-5'-phosphate decarboxylase